MTLTDADERPFARARQMLPLRASRRGSSAGRSRRASARLVERSFCCQMWFPTSYVDGPVEELIPDFAGDADAGRGVLALALTRSMR